MYERTNSEMMMINFTFGEEREKKIDKKKIRSRFLFITRHLNLMTMTIIKLVRLLKSFLLLLLLLYYFHFEGKYLISNPNVFVLFNT